MESILTSIKKLLGIAEHDTSFDTDVIMHINTVFMILGQVGVGPEGGFSIEDSSAEWTDFIEDTSKIEGMKTYIYLKVKEVFDPPSNSAILQSMKDSAKELEWRLNIECDPYDL
jgi:hypothetical protein